MVSSRSRRATSRDNVASHSVSHAALSQATLFWERASDRDSCTVRTARSISRQRRKRSAASPRRRLSVSGEWNIPARNAEVDEGRKAETGKRRQRGAAGSRITGMWAPSPSIMARSRCERARENKVSFYGRFVYADTYKEKRRPMRYKEEMSAKKPGWTATWKADT